MIGFGLMFLMIGGIILIGSTMLVLIYRDYRKNRGLKSGEKL